jgi:hypothetical protein
MNNPDESYAAARKELEAHFKVSRQSIDAWHMSNREKPEPGSVCICGHPETTHSQSGLCAAGVSICFCRAPKPVVNVSDVRYFFRATKGPHEAHALSLGLQNLRNCGGTGQFIARWQCQSEGCTRTQGVGPVRLRSGGLLSLGLSVKDQHRLMCETCLFTRLNGGYPIG